MVLTSICWIMYAVLSLTFTVLHQCNQLHHIAQIHCQVKKCQLRVFVKAAPHVNITDQLCIHTISCWGTHMLHWKKKYPDWVKLVRKMLAPSIRFHQERIVCKHFLYAKILTTISVLLTSQTWYFTVVPITYFSTGYAPM